MRKTLTSQRKRISLLEANFTNNQGLAYTLSKASEPLLSMASSTFLMLPLFLLPHTLSLLVSAKIVLEDGYTVDTIIDGHKLNINPHMVLPRSGSSDLVILDSVQSVFYTVHFPVFQDGAVRRLSGDGSFGYSDGDVGSAQFNKPKSFAVDFKGNVYVADKNNHVIRKISGSGVTTIAGGLSQKVGNEDGPAQNASFSNDVELAFAPGKCALLVSDRGNQLVRQINLKEEDCTLGSKSGLGAGMMWTLGLVLSCLLGIIIGIVVRPYIIRHTGRLQAPLLPRDMEALPSQSGEESTDTLLRHQKRSC